MDILHLRIIFARKSAGILFQNVIYREKTRIHRDQYENFHLKFLRMNWNKQRWKIVIDRIVDREKTKKKKINPA